MLKDKSLFLKKTILIYGLGKSGLSSYQFLKNRNKLYLFDDKKELIKDKNIKKKLIKYTDIKNKQFDHIIISPGININRCRLNKYLKKNSKKIKTDLDIFYSEYEGNKNITITGTNGKSTTAKILFDVLNDQKYDVRLVGNIGYPILFEKNITKRTIFVIEASSYQLEYSKLFKTDFSVILNISPDHLERHGTLKNYVNAKFKLVENQNKKGITFLNTKNIYIKKKIQSIKIIPKIIQINKKISTKFLDKINNQYFITENNKENLSFIIEIAKKLNIKQVDLIKTLKKFNGLKYRQQIIYKSKSLTIINDSKATSFSSSVGILKSLSNVYWIVGGLSKKGDRFLLSKSECKTFKAYIFGKNRSFFYNNLKNFMQCQIFSNLEYSLKQILLDIKKKENNQKKIILFSPAAASFDSFKNFEDRGMFFNNLIKKTINAQ